LSSLKVKPVEKNQLFFGSYRYSVRFDIRELGIIRGLNPDKIDQLVADRNRWREEHRQLYGAMIRMHQIDSGMKQNLEDLCRLLVPHKEQLKFVISYDRGYVYTNDFELVKTLANLSILDKIQIQEAHQICPQGTIALHDPKWTHRTYFRSKAVDEIQRKTLAEYLKARENVRMGPGLKGWINTPGNNWWVNWTHSHFFIDHNNDGELLFLNMVVPNITRQTKQIVAK
jgi:hypothetical protein